MPAQIGGALVLSYGPQGSRQAGGAVLLDAIPARTSRTIAASTRAPWRPSAAIEQTRQAVYQPTSQQNPGLAARWGAGRGQDRASGSRWLRAIPADDAAAAPWGHFTGRASLEQLAAWAIAAPSDQAAAAPWGRYALADLAQRLAFPRSRGLDRVRWIPWRRYSRDLAAGWGVVVPINDAGPGEALFVVPLRNVYMQANTTTLRRVDTNAPIVSSGLSLSLDADSWVWTFSASLRADQLPQVRRTAGEPPIELEATINGTPFRLLVESVGKDRSFASERIRIGGRGKTALLDAPYAPVRNFGNDSAARTLQQLMGDVLTDNGASIGWSVTDFGLEDYLVPAAVFSHRGTYIGALNELAQAAGAYIQPHDTAQELAVLPRYPAAPWEWATIAPDYEVPADVMVNEGIEWTERPIYNRVFVSGVAAGVLGQVTRAGTAGDLVAPLITHPLITTAAAARQRALPVLAEGGTTATYTLRFPVLDGLGIVRPGKFLRYVEGSVQRIGLIRSVAVDAKHPSTWQTIQLETHE